MVLYFVINQPASGLSDQTIRIINGIGIWFQLFGVILVSFEFLRGPLAMEQKKDYEGKRKELSDDFNNRIIPEKQYNDISQHQDKVNTLNSVYFSVNNFELTVRKVYWVGLIAICFGYVLQLSVN